MRLRSLHLLPVLLLALGACATAPVTVPEPASSSSSVSAQPVSAAPVAPQFTGSGTKLTIRLEKSESEDSGGVLRTKATLHLTGAINTDVPLKDIVGHLSLAQKPYVQPAGSGTTVAVLSAWWAGGGEEIWITQYHNPHALTVEYIRGSEGDPDAPPADTCDGPGLITDLPMQGDVTVTLEGFGKATAPSVLAWCQASRSKGQSSR
jgi:hypothetical protein